MDDEVAKGGDGGDASADTGSDTGDLRATRNQDHEGVSAHEKALLGQHMWARGYFCCSTGNVTDEIIAQYIANQTDNRDDDFKVEG